MDSGFSFNIDFGQQFKIKVQWRVFRFKIVYDSTW